MFDTIKTIYNKYATERNMYLLVALFIFLRICFAFITGGDFNSAEDLKIAYNLNESGDYVLHEHLGPTAMKSPLYPVFLSAVLFVTGASGEWGIVIIQHLLMGIVPILLYKTALLISDRKRAFFVGLLFLGHFSYFYYPNVIEITNLFVPLLSLFFYQLLKSRESGKYLFLGFISGLLVLLQPTIIPVLFMSALLLYKRLGISKIFQIALIVSIMQAPWIYRNYATFDKFIPTKSPFWMVLYLGIIPENQEKSVEPYLEDATMARIDFLKDMHNDVVMEKHYKAAFMEFWEAKSDQYPIKLLNHIKYYWHLPPRYIDDIGLPIIAVRVLPNFILIVLTIWGLKRAFSEDKTLTIYILGVLLFYTLVYSLTHAANIRYKLDVEFLQMFIAMYVLKPYKQSAKE